MLIHFYKYQGAGNDFIIIDNREKRINLNTKKIYRLCDRHFGIGADGLILLEHSSKADFKMIYFNSDGKKSTMCGNGGRCIVAFAHKLKLIKKHTHFEAVDGLHYAEIIQDNLIRLQMQNVSEIQEYNNDFIVNTGSPHYVKIVSDASSVNVCEEGRKIRYAPPFHKEGINVNFVQIKNSRAIHVRTYERGVENETLSCGTGVTAAALVTTHIHSKNKNKVQVTTLGGKLQIECQLNNSTYQNIFLTGNAEFIFKGEINI